MWLIIPNYRIFIYLNNDTGKNFNMTTNQLCYVKKYLSSSLSFPRTFQVVPVEGKEREYIH